MTRVGRNAHRSSGRGIGIHGLACSDCVVIVRPKKVKMATKILFALRVILSQNWAKPLVERGTGASYVSHRSLLALPIPLGVCTRYRRQFQIFKHAQQIKSARQSQQAVETVAERIATLCTQPNCSDV